MSEREMPISLSISDAALRAHMREQAALWYGGKVSPYIVELIELDRSLQLIRTDRLRRAGVVESEPERELAAVS